MDLRLMIKGIVSDKGSAQASRIPGNVHQARCEITDEQLVRGTLNISVANLNQLIDRLGEPRHLTDKEAERGPLRWWHARIIFDRFPGRQFDGFIVRLVKSRTPYVEFVSQTYFRDEGVCNGDSLMLVPL